VPAAHTHTHKASAQRGQQEGNETSRQHKPPSSPSSRHCPHDREGDYRRQTLQLRMELGNGEGEREGRVVVGD
jgi:hypothetical protein